MPVLNISRRRWFKINKKSQQVGLLLEIFLVIIILILFIFFWSSYSRTTFLAGIFKIDDAALRHSCSNLAPVLVGSNYIVSTTDRTKAVDGLLNYLGYEGEMISFPDAEYFYQKIRIYFPELQNRVFIKVTSSTGEVYEKNMLSPNLLGIYKIASCDFPLYSTNKSLTAVLHIEVNV